MTQRKNSKIWRATKSAVAGVMVQERSAHLIGDRNNFVAVDNLCVSITGKSISFNTTSENIRRGGLFVGQNDLVRMVPQTLVTPLGSNMPWPPLGLVGGATKDLAFFMGVSLGFAAITAAVG